MIHWNPKSKDGRDAWFPARPSLMNSLNLKQVLSVKMKRFGIGQSLGRGAKWIGLMGDDDAGTCCDSTLCFFELLDFSYGGKDGGVIKSGGVLL